jgi:hypothetical protein
VRGSRVAANAATKITLEAAEAPLRPSGRLKPLRQGFLRPLRAPDALRAC